MESPLMEDVDLAKKLCKVAGPPAIAPAPMLVSARRWEHMGYLKTTVLNLCIMSAYKLGVSTDRLARWYYG